MRVMDVRRWVPRTDVVLAVPAVVAAVRRVGHRRVKQVVAVVQQRVREGVVPPAALVAEVLAALPDTATTLRPVLNATGVLLHTNLGRASLSAAAVEALGVAAGATDVEFDLVTGGRGRRGTGALAALAEAVPAAGGVAVVNNGAAALVLAATALAAGREIVLARGEMVEIGDGFRIPELLESTGARLCEVGTTNRVAREDYTAAIGPQTGFVLKVHPSNFRITGFTSSVPVRQLSGLGVPVVADIGSGLLAPHPTLPEEPDAATTLAHGADLVTASGDKLLGGPQAGLLLGCEQLVTRLCRHPLARALRVDKLTLAALEATLRGPATPTAQALATNPSALQRRARAIAGALAARGVDATAVASRATVGGGGAPGVTLDSAAVSLPERYAALLRAGNPPVLGRVHAHRCLLDLRAVDAEQDTALRDAVLACPS